MVLILNNEMNELFELNESVSIRIELLDESFQVFIVNWKVNFVKELGQLSFAERSIAVSVKFSEDFS